MVNKNHQAKLDLMKAFEKTERSMPSNTEMGGGRYEMAASTGLPRTPAQMASVKKAAQKSAESRRAQAKSSGAMEPVAVNPKKGLLSL